VVGAGRGEGTRAVNPLPIRCRPAFVETWSDAVDDGVRGVSGGGHAPASDDVDAALLVQVGSRARSGAAAHDRQVLRHAAQQPSKAASGRVRTSVGLPTLPQPAGCFEVNCSVALRQHLFCVSAREGSGGSVAAAVLSGAGAGAGLTQGQRASTWVSALNYASHALAPPSRYEVMMKVRAAGSVVDDARRPRAKGMLEETAYRETWVISFLAALRRSGACPHFPLLLDTMRCSKLPATLSSPPSAAAVGVGVGVLPPGVPGSAGITTGLSMQVDASGGAAGGAVHWHAVTTDTVQGDLAQVLGAYKLPLLPPALLRGLLFQLIYALAVGRHAFGLHHNGLLSLSSVKVHQVPLASPNYRPFECYLVSPHVMAGLPLLVRRNGTGSPANGKASGGEPAFLWAPGSEGDACSQQGSRVASAPVPADDRVDWCMPAAEVDGLRVVLHDYGAASLVRKQLEWWAAGYAFPNTPWRDDLHDLAVSLCGVGGERVAGFTTWAGGQLQDLCNRMAAGRYSSNPARALQHPVFTGDASAGHAGYPMVAAVAPETRNLYAYTPATVPPPTPAGAAAAKVSPAPAAGPAVVQPPRPQPGRDGAAPTTRNTTSGRDGVPTTDGSSLSSASSGGMPAAANATTPGTAARRGVDVSAMATQATMLAALTPARPWIARRDASTVTVAWAAVDTLDALPSAQPAAYNLLLDGVSAYSGSDTQHEVGLAAAMQTACLPLPEGGLASLRFAVAAYYTGLGWTPLSEALDVVVPCA